MLGENPWRLGQLQTPLWHDLRSVFLMAAYLPNGQPSNARLRQLLHLLVQLQALIVRRCNLLRTYHLKVIERSQTLMLGRKTSFHGRRHLSQRDRITGPSLNRTHALSLNTHRQWRYYVRHGIRLLMVALLLLILKLGVQLDFRGPEYLRPIENQAISASLIHKVV